MSRSRCGTRCEARAMFSRLSIASKTALMTGFLAALFAVAQVTGIAYAVSEGGVRLWIVVAITVAVPTCLVSLVATLWTSRITRHRTARFVRVLDRIATGELQGELEP